MTVTFQQAREIVMSRLSETWPQDAGTLMVAEYGFEDAAHWHVIAGAKESLVDEDPDYDVMDAPALLIDKATGELTELVVIDSFQRLDAMTPVGTHPA